MAEFPALPLFTDAYLADTGHLSGSESGAYLHLLIAAWRAPDCALPDDDIRLARWARVGLRSWKRLKPAVMAFWKLTDGLWTQARLLDERVHVQQVAARNRAAAAARWDGKPLKNKKGRHARASSTQYLLDAPTPTPTPTPTNKIVSLEFEKFKKAYPSRKGGQGWTEAKKHFDRAIKDGCDAASLILAAEKYAKTIASAVGTEFVPMARTWLSKRDYLDFLPTPEDTEKQAKDAEFMRNKGYEWTEGIWKKTDGSEN